tara:strand:- start:193 stop:486 length:294 start_codon:yes stop_codon:yes gene_type:complete
MEGGVKGLAKTAAKAAPRSSELPRRRTRPGEGSVRLALGAGSAHGGVVRVVDLVALFLGVPFTAFLADDPFVLFFPLAGVVVIKVATTHRSLLLKLG